MEKVYLVRGYNSADRKSSWWNVYDSINDAVSQTVDNQSDEELEQPVKEGVVVYEATPKLIGSFQMNYSAVKIEPKKKK